MPMTYLTGIPFSFDVPSLWLCATLDEADTGVKATAVAKCMSLDKSAVGSVGIQKCAPTGCNDTDRTALSNQVHVDAEDWRSSDPDTTYTDFSGTLDNGKPATRVGMFYRYASTSGGPKDTIAFVVLTGDPPQRETMLKLVNEVRTRAAKSSGIPS